MDVPTVTVLLAGRVLLFQEPGSLGGSGMMRQLSVASFVGRRAILLTNNRVVLFAVEDQASCLRCKVMAFKPKTTMQVHNALTWSFPLPVCHIHWVFR